MNGSFDFSGEYDPSSFVSPTKSTTSRSSLTPHQTPERASGNNGGGRMTDRFIPDREAQDAQLSHYVLTTKENVTPTHPASSPSTGSRPSEPYANMLAKTLFSGRQPSVLGLHSVNDAGNAVSEGERYNQSLGVVYHENYARNFRSKSFRVIPQTPERILDAPELLDDFYLNLIDWSSENILTVALNKTVYLWNANDGSITQLMTNERGPITGVSWHSDGNLLAIGTADSRVLLYDTTTEKLVRTMRGHTARVSSLSWSGSFLASGSRDHTIRFHDMRDAKAVGVCSGHRQEVCGLRFNQNHTGSLLASGGNDNVVNVWDLRHDTLEPRPLWSLCEHTAAIKALAWNPVQPNLLASGGGSADKKLRFWDITTGTCISHVDTQSQVCGVLWNNAGTELVTSHGYSDYQLTLWKYPSLKRNAELMGHTSRVLHLAMSPEGEMVVSAAGDETIRFWRCFAPTTPTTNDVTSPMKTMTPKKTPKKGHNTSADLDLSNASDQMVDELLR